jgi:hypothetical protein
MGVALPPTAHASFGEISAAASARTVRGRFRRLSADRRATTTPLSAVADACPSARPPSQAARMLARGTGAWVAR